MKIAIGTDHRGFVLKEEIKKHYNHYEWTDVGAYDNERSDYPEYVGPVVEAVLSDAAECGILLCGSGIGMAIAANRSPYIYAAVVWGEECARQAKTDDNVNIVVLPADFISVEQAITIIDAWLAAPFKGGRYAQRLAMIDNQ